MIIFILGVIGLCLGSFVNALVWRIWVQSEESKTAKTNTKKAKKVDYSILHGRSMCVHCKHELSWVDLVPLASWIALRGKCRYCKKAISWQYPLVELLTALLFVASYIFWPTGLTSFLDIANFASWLILLVGFVALAVYDIRWMILPNRLVYPMIVLASVLALVNVASGDSSVVSAALNCISSIMIAGGVFYLIFQLSNGNWIGGGDVKLGILIGLVVQDPYKAFMTLFLASILGTLIAVPSLLLGKMNSRSKLPFGPFLIIATIIIYLFGSSIIAWYKREVLLLG